MRQKTRAASFQYHPLFRECLLSRENGAFSEEEISAIKRKGALLLSKHGDIENAVPLHLTVKDWPEAIRLINGHAASLFEQGRSSTVRDWLDSLPAELVEADAGNFTDSWWSFPRNSVLPLTHHRQVASGREAENAVCCRNVAAI